MVTYISQERLVMFFTEALSEPLQGWVKAFNPTTLQEAIKKTRDMGNATVKSKAPPKPFFPPKNKEKKAPQHDWPKRDRSDEGT